jgi:DNA mismatch repair protein MutL
VPNLPETVPAPEPSPAPESSPATAYTPVQNASPEIPAPAVPPVPAVLPEDTRPEPVRPEEKNAAVSAIQKESITVIGELFDNYVLAQAGENFVMLDKHAAHERILFERFRRRECRDRQTLLTPVRLLLTADEADALRLHTEELEQCGFVFEFDELPVVKLTGVPLSCADLDLDAAAAELAEACLQERADPGRHMLDNKFHDLACKAAIRAGDHSTREELQSLAEQVWGDERIRHCPHGRPVMFLLSRYQIEKQFQRIQH